MALRRTLGRQAQDLSDLDPAAALCAQHRNELDLERVKRGSDDHELAKRVTTGACPVQVRYHDAILNATARSRKWPLRAQTGPKPSSGDCPRTSRFAPPVGNRTAVREWVREDETAALCVKTVETHVSAVLPKLQLLNRNELTRWAAERRLI